jgi:hypothetical protein
MNFENLYDIEKWNRRIIILFVECVRLRPAVPCQSAWQATPFTRIAILTKRWNRSVCPFTLMAPSRVKKDSRTSGRPFCDGATEGCEATASLYFTSALLVLYPTIIFLQVSYLTWPFSSGPITYRSRSLHANFIYPPFCPLSCVIFFPHSHFLLQLWYIRWKLSSRIW